MFICKREGGRLYERLFSPPDFRVLLEETESCIGEFEGIVLFSETQEEHNVFLLETENEGKIRCFSAPESRCPLPGETVRVKGTASLYQGAANPGMFDTRGYYDHLGIWFKVEAGEASVVKVSRARIQAAVFRIRERARKIIREYADAEDVSVYLTLFCGDKSELTGSERDSGDYGLSFLISFSGLHVTLIAGALYRLLRKISDKWWAALGALLFSVTLYFLGGRSASIFRGALIVLCRAAAPLIKRKFDYISAGALAVILLVLSCPGLIFTSSFAFMAASLAAIGLFYPALRDIFSSGDRRVSSLLFLLSLQCFLLPVRLYTSFEFQILSPLLSFFSLMIFPVLLFSVYSGTILGFISGRAAVILYLPGHTVLRLYRILIETVGTWGFTRITGRPERIGVLIYYAVLFAVFLALRLFFLKNCSLPEGEEKEPRPREYLLIISLLTGILTSGILFLGFRGPEEGSILAALSVGQGDCNLILTGDHEAVVIDCGSAGVSDLYADRIRPALRYFGIRRITAVFISHTDTDHVSGLIDLTKDYVPDYLFYPECEEASEKASGLVTARKGRNTVFSGLSAGEKVALPGAGTMTVLWPEKGEKGTSGNDTSLVLSYEENGFRALYTGDISSAEEAMLPLSGEKYDYLKVAHHGSKYSTSAAFLALTRPGTASVSCSRYNTYGHPAPETLKRLSDAGTEVHILWEEGALILYTEKDCLAE